MGHWAPVLITQRVEPLFWPFPPFDGLHGPPTAFTALWQPPATLLPSLPPSLSLPPPSHSFFLFIGFSFRMPEPYQSVVSTGWNASNRRFRTVASICILVEPVLPKCKALFVFLLLPFLSNVRGIPFPELPSYIKSGAACFLNLGGNMTGCEGAPLLPLLFIMMNMAFNISLLGLVKISSALVASLAATLAVPISIYILSLPLPYIPQGTCLNAYFIIGAAIVVLGLILYNLPQSANWSHKSD